MGGVTDVHFYTGAIPGETPLAMKWRPKIWFLNLDWFLRFGAAHRYREGRDKHFPLMGQTDGRQVFATGRVR